MKISISPIERDSQALPDGRYLLAALKAEDEKTANEVIDALRGAGLDNLSIVDEPPFFPADTAAEPDVSSLFADESPAEGAAFEQVNASSAEVQKIVLTSDYDAPWPEDGYRGDYRNAYKHIVDKLHGIEPKTDQGDTITVAMITKIERPKKIGKKAWQAVVDHLCEEMTCFGYAHDWFASNGYVHAFLSDQVTLNTGGLKALQTDTFAVDGNKQMTLFTEVFIGVAVRLIGKAGTAGLAIAIAFDAAYKIARATQPDVKAKITDAVDRMQVELTEQFGKLLDGNDHSYTTLIGNWGKLSAFAGLLHGGMKWPKDGSEARRLAALAFHATVTPELIKLTKWRTMLGRSVKAGKNDHARQFHPEKGDYHLYTHAEYQGWLIGWWRMEYYLGYYYVERTPVGPITHFEEAPRVVQAKVFGVDQCNPVNPQLKMPAGFLLYPKAKQYQDWEMSSAILS